uniref:Tachykinin-related peptide 4 n=1 Tax=Oncopeltus fasciatus TaxID=7536 RepID=TRP4_ONCFA|nr:RecName: Full=Tachykinin-related peptide 4; Short=TKRP-4 [Oncopeltus fasciatus]
NPASGFFGMR